MRSTIAKHRYLIFSFFLVFLVTLSLLCGAQNVSDQNLMVNGNFIGEENNNMKTSLQIFKESELLKEEEFIGNSFRLDLPLNESCTLVFIRDNFVGKCVIFNTHSSSINESKVPFKLALKLIDQEKYQSGQLSIDDVPVGMVKYDEKSNDFKYSDMYHDHVWQEHRQRVQETLNPQEGKLAESKIEGQEY